MRENKKGSVLILISLFFFFIAPAVFAQPFLLDEPIPPDIIKSYRDSFDGVDQLAERIKKKGMELDAINNTIQETQDKINVNDRRINGLEKKGNKPSQFLKDIQSSLIQNIEDSRKQERTIKNEISFLNTELKQVIWREAEIGALLSRESVHDWKQYIAEIKPAIEELRKQDKEDQLLLTNLQRKKIELADKAGRFRKERKWNETIKITGSLKEVNAEVRKILMKIENTHEILAQLEGRLRGFTMRFNIMGKRASDLFTSIRARIKFLDEGASSATVASNQNKNRNRIP